ncbi:MAG TPA: methionine ABC transporter ATP-binding protein [Burkholderiaceae bacterium]|jgi:D-methionine transport system ATP-binding protein
MIELRDIHKSYQVKGVAIPALTGIDLTVQPGEIFGIIGHSGAGKSTLIRIVNLLERPSSGQVIVGGVDLLSLGIDALRRFRQGVGMIFQHFNLLGSKTVGENIAYPMKIVGQADAAAIDRRVDELLELVGLTRHKHKYPKQLSGGEKQRVGIARALANHPSVLLCDEATSALDPQTTRAILALLREINEKLRLTIVLITHEMDVIRTVCDRVAVIDSGKIVESGPVTQVFLHPRHPTTQRFVQETESFSAEDERLELAGGARRTIRRLTFLDDTVHQPLLTRSAREHGVDYAILSGRFGQIKATACGQVTVSVEGAPAQVQAALAQLAAAGVSVEEHTA